MEGVEEGLLVKRADNSGTMKLAFEDATMISRPHVSRDGSRIVYKNIETGGLTIRSLSDPDSIRVIDRGSSLNDPALSNNGNYVAFVTQENGAQEIYVQNAESDAMWTVSLPNNDSPARPSWSPDGEWLYYRNLGELWRSRVHFQPTFRRETPQLVLAVAGVIDFDLHPDGKRILINRSVQSETGASSTQIRLSLRMNLGRQLNEIAPANE